MGQNRTHAAQQIAHMAVMIYSITSVGTSKQGGRNDKAKRLGGAEVGGPAAAPATNKRRPPSSPESSDRDRLCAGRRFGSACKAGGDRVNHYGHVRYLLRCMSPVLALRVISRAPNNPVAFGAKRTSTSRQPPLNRSKMTRTGLPANPCVVSPRATRRRHSTVSVWLAAAYATFEIGSPSLWPRPSGRLRNWRPQCGFLIQ